MKRYAISTDIRRAVCSKGFLAAVVGMVLIMAIASIQAVSEALMTKNAMAFGFHSQLTKGAIQSFDVALALPIFCALPYTASFVDEFKSGYIKEYLPRIGVDRYIFGKLSACAVSGGLALFVGVYLFYGIAALVFSPMELALEAGVKAEPIAAYIFQKALVLFFSGAFWSLCGFTFASLSMSRYMAYASPFILYYVLVILHERYLKDLFVLYPKEWLAMTQMWVLDSYGVMILLFVLSCVICLLFAAMARRRLSNV